MSSDNSRSDGPIPGDHTDNDQQEPAPHHMLRWQLLAWIVLIVGLLVWFAVGSVSTTSYSYNQFLEMTFRQVSETPLQDIWTYQAQHLPSADLQSVLDAAFVASILTVVVGVFVGSWLLLVRASDDAALPRRRGRRFLHDQSG